MLNIEKVRWKKLFCDDAGFVDYDFWKGIADRGRHFLMRVGSNVTLLRKLGRMPIYLVTNVLDPEALTGDAACQFYQLSWGIELQFRTLKQTFGRSKLRIRTPDHALRELDWSLLRLWMIQLFAVKEQIAIGEPPTHSSAELAIRAMFHSWSQIPTRGTSLKTKMRHATTDHHERSKKSKQSRYRPDNKDKPHAGNPVIITATKQHKSQLKE